MTQKDGNYQHEGNKMTHVTQLVHETCTSVLHGKKCMNRKTMSTDKVDDANEKRQFHISSAKCITE